MRTPPATRKNLPVRLDFVSSREPMTAATADDRVCLEENCPFAVSDESSRCPMHQLASHEGRTTLNVPSGLQCVPHGAACKPVRLPRMPNDAELSSLPWPLDVLNGDDVELFRAAQLTPITDTRSTTGRVCVARVYWAPHSSFRPDDLDLSDFADACNGASAPPTLRLWHARQQSPRDSPSDRETTAGTCRRALRKCRVHHALSP